MKATLNDKLIAYLVLISGLSISAISIYYSVMGLIAIYPAMVLPIVIMGVVIEFGKLSALVWVKKNWDWAPIFLKIYIIPAITLLMLITSVGVFGFLSKAHSDQNLVSGDVQARIAVYDEKIKIAKDNIDANRKALKQMDEAVDQVMGRSSDEKGADKAVAVRRGQQKERARLQSEIQTEQATIGQLSEERAPIAAEVRKVEAEVGPIKYIAAFIYGDNPDANILERAVTWVTILIVIVLDPMAVILLLASQYSFQRFRQQEEEVNPKQPDTSEVGFIAQELADVVPEAVHIDEKPIEEKDDFLPTYEEITPSAEGNSPARTEDSSSTVTNYTFVDEHQEPDHGTAMYESDDGQLTDAQLAQIRAEIEERHKKIPDVFRTKIFKRTDSDSYVQNEEQKESNLWAKTTGIDKNAG
jgi:hypothetical protein